MLPAATAAALAVAALAPAARAQWVQFISIPLCRNTTASTFSAGDLTYDILAPASVTGSAPRCIVDSTSATTSIYYELAANKNTVTLYQCSTTTCTSCKASNVIPNIAGTTAPDCGEYFQYLTASTNLDDGLPNVSVKYGGGALAASYFTIIKSATNSANPCGGVVQYGNIDYLFEECTQATPTTWLKSVFDPTSDRINTYTCTASDCQTGCKQALWAYKPAPPSQKTCHSDAIIDASYGTATPLKSSSRYNKPAATDFNPASLGSGTSGQQSGNTTTNTNNGGSSGSGTNMGMIIGIVAGAVVVIGGIIGAVVMLRRRNSGGSAKSAPVPLPTHQPVPAHQEQMPPMAAQFQPQPQTMLVDQYGQPQQFNPAISPAGPYKPGFEQPKQMYHGAPPSVAPSDYASQGGHTSLQPGFTSGPGSTSGAQSTIVASHHPTRSSQDGSQHPFGGVADIHPGDQMFPIVEARPADQDFPIMEPRRS
ncbi:hypothetical protein HK105_205183 [Polyrhizophydium stewartii]|uniref:Uncharacterized protein n=1 Tax=Polyrhizophydium stewartii TaxID=2732419 RepID=A0ABR4N6Z9_9FUNG